MFVYGGHAYVIARRQPNFGGDYDLHVPNLPDTDAQFAVYDASYAATTKRCALWSIDPTSGIAGVRRAAEVLATPWVVGVYDHVHSFDRPFDHADFYPYYALCADTDVPMVMQAGASGGLMPSECGMHTSPSAL